MPEKRSRRVRVSIWGDSHVAGDVFDRLRERMQQELGDAGPGFVLLGRPWRSYRHGRLKLAESKGWRAERIWSKYSRRHPQPRDDLLGLAGVSVHAPGPATASITLRAPGSLTLIELYYLMQPSGGKIELLVEGKRVKWLFSVASEREAAFARVDLPLGTRRAGLETSGGAVRLFGADLESVAPGAVVDAFGINGARAAKLREWNEALLGEQLRRHGQHAMTTVPAINAGESTGTPSVATVRDYWPVCYWADLIYVPARPDLCPACTVSMMTRCVRPRAGGVAAAAWPLIPYMRANLQTKRSTLPRAGAIIAPSHAITRDLRARAPELANTPLYTIPNPVDMTRLDEIAGQSPRPRPDPYALYAGKLATNKGVQYLLRAYKQAGITWPLVVAGDGPQRAEHRSHRDHHHRNGNQISGLGCAHDKFESSRRLASAFGHGVRAPVVFPTRLPAGALFHVDPPGFRRAGAGPGLVPMQQWQQP